MLANGHSARYRGDVVPTSGIPSAAYILVVDDEPGVRRLACQTLARGGYATIEAEDGAEALRILEDATPAIALVLSDIRMPRLDGVQLESACRERWPGLPVVLMSGEVTRDWVVRLVREGAHPVIRKPFQADTLLQAIRAILESPTGEGDNLAGGESAR
ncbi:MAG TPA: response regulator [Gemmatimonadales bacterium]|nr:response regulator [Gemmatimonadales bacterium]